MVTLLKYVCISCWRTECEGAALSIYKWFQTHHLPQKWYFFKTKLVHSLYVQKWIRWSPTFSYSFKLITHPNICGQAGVQSEWAGHIRWSSNTEWKVSRRWAKPKSDASSLPPPDNRWRASTDFWRVSYGCRLVAGFIVSFVSQWYSMN